MVEIQIPGELIRRCAAGECVLFAGSGLSIAAGFPTYRDLLLQIIEILMREDGLDEWDSLTRTLMTAGPSFVMDQLRSKFHSHHPDAFRITELVERVLGGVEPRFTALHEEIRTGPFSGVLSSTWDTSLEVLLRERQPLFLTSRSSADILSWLREPRFFLLKLYGDPRERWSFLFGDEDLRRVLYEQDIFAKFLGQLVKNRTILFVGASAQVIEAFFGAHPALSARNGTERHHYALFEEVSEDKLRIDLLQDKYGVRPFGVGDTRAVVSFLRDLRNLVVVDEVLTAEPRESPQAVEASTLDRVVLTNIGPFEDLDLPLSRGWNVLLGNNGCGKSVILRAIALGLAGDDPRAAEHALSLLREGSEAGSIELHTGDQRFRTELVRSGRTVKVRAELLTPLQAGRWVALGFPALRGASLASPAGPTSDGEAPPGVDDVLPLVRGAVDHRLDTTKQWIINTQVRAQIKRRSGDSTRHAEVLGRYFDLLDRLTPGVECKFDSVDLDTWQVMLRTGDGIVPMDRLSQGTSSIFGWVGTLIQRMFEIHGKSESPEREQAFLLIDEIDAHMHPEWQRDMVPLLREHFPRLQVIASSHSPLVVGSLDANEVYHLRRTPERPGVLVEHLETSFQGWRADQILTGPPFALETTVSKHAESLMDEYAKLLGKAKRTRQQQRRLSELTAWIRAEIPSHPETPAGREALVLFERWMNDQLAGKTADHRRKVLAEAEKLLAQMEPKT